MQAFAVATNQSTVQANHPLTFPISAEMKGEKKGKNFGGRENARTFKSLTVNSDEASEQLAAVLRFFNKKLYCCLQSRQGYIPRFQFTMSLTTCSSPRRMCHIII